ncbi:MAG: YlmC/YmxH family sporulation protein [Clostridia bacterium]|nr:YlmC/YmxH family sporulation protein [Clostridia bacterium]
MTVRYSKLKDKEVINVCNGTRLGYIADIEIDLNSGRILRILVPKSGKCLSFTSAKHPIIIPWQNIERIGDDAILVRIAELSCP